MAKTILITGAGTGIGKAAAAALLARGHAVYATTHHDDEIAPLQQALGPGATVFRLDITDPADRARLADLPLDVLINNAGQAESGSLAEIDMDRVRHLFEVNLFSTLELTQTAIPPMIARGGGTVIFVSSVAGRIPLPFLMPYAMTKFALSAGAAGLRSEMQTLGKGIQVCLIEPGAYDTGFNRRMAESRYEWMARDSLFSEDQIAKMKSDSRRLLGRAEIASLDSITAKIVTAAEARRPRLRYVAPWYIAGLVRVLRALGV